MPKKLFIAFLIIVGLSVAVSPTLALPSFQIAQLDTPGTTRILTLPRQADNSPVISLGSATDPRTGKKVEGIAFIHYQKGFSHNANHNFGSKSQKNKCFSYLAKGSRWKTVEPWVMNPTNSRGLDQETLFWLQTNALEKWEDAADGLVGNGSLVQIFGPGSSTDAILSADTSSPDGLNEVYFADISTPGAIAVTIVWGVFYGPISQRELVEWDQVYDDVDFDWSAQAEGVPGKMDFDNIATHEDGHAGGMGHPSDSCTEETMYRFADFGETKKRDLHTGDISGIDGLY